MIDAGVGIMIGIFSLVSGVMVHHVATKEDRKHIRKVAHEKRINPDWCETRLMQDPASGDLYKIIECEEGSDPPTIRIEKTRKIGVDR